MSSVGIFLIGLVLAISSANGGSRSRRQLFDSYSNNVGGVHETTNNVGPFVGVADAVKALPPLPVSNGPLVNIGDVNIGNSKSGNSKSRQRRQLFNSDSNNTGGVHQTTNNVGPFVGVADAVKALPPLPVGQGPLVNVGNVNARQTRSIISFCFIGIGCDEENKEKPVINSDIGHVGGSYQTVNTVNSV